MANLDLNISDEMFANPEAMKLLPVEKDGENGKEKCLYLAEVTGSKQVDTKKGGKMLNITFSIDYKGTRYNVFDMFTYNPQFLERFVNFIKLMNINPKGLTEESFIGRFVWLSIKHENYPSSTETDESGNPKIIWSNKVDKFIRQASEEEVTGQPAGTGENPF